MIFQNPYEFFQFLISFLNFSKSAILFLRNSMQNSLSATRKTPMHEFIAPMQKVFGHFVFVKFNARLVISNLNNPIKRNLIKNRTTASIHVQVFWIFAHWAVWILDIFGTRFHTTHTFVKNGICMNVKKILKIHIESEKSLNPFESKQRIVYKIIYLFILFTFLNEFLLFTITINNFSDSNNKRNWKK